MFNKTGVILILALLALGFMVFGAACQTDEMDAEVHEEQIVLEEQGIMTGQIDSHSVEIEVDGQLMVFALAEGVNVADISDGSAVNFTYIEAEDRPVIRSIESAETEAEVVEGEGVYNGQVDSNSVEIETDGQLIVFFLDENVTVDHIKDGAYVEYTYREEVQRPVLKSIGVIEEPAVGGNGVLVGEGILVGLIDSRSVEIEMDRAFMLGEEIFVDDIEDGSLVAFTYTETGQRAVIESIEAVDEPVEGEVMHGTLVGQIDSQSVEIKYFQAFTLGEGVSVEEIADGTEIVFTYQIDSYRPVLKTVTKK